jgi:uncharacterized protein (DUF433 family)
MKNWRERIRVNPAVCHGRACIRGTRVLVSAVVDNIASGLPRDEILRSYATLTERILTRLWRVPLNWHAREL